MTSTLETQNRKEKNKSGNHDHPANDLSYANAVGGGEKQIHSKHSNRPSQQSYLVWGVWRQMSGLIGIR